MLIPVDVIITFTIFVTDIPEMLILYAHNVEIKAEQYPINAQLVGEDSSQPPKAVLQFKSSSKAVMYEFLEVYPQPQGNEVVVEQEDSALTGEVLSSIITKMINSCNIGYVMAA